MKPNKHLIKFAVYAGNKELIRSKVIYNDLKPYDIDEILNIIKTSLKLYMWSSRYNIDIENIELNLKLERLKK